MISDCIMNHCVRLNPAVPRNFTGIWRIRHCRYCSSRSKEIDPHERASKPLTRVPEFQSYEPFWYEYWKQKSLLKSSAGRNGKTGVFSLILPPPNITGNLHLGHALTVTLQDALLRYNRMKGMDTQWIPGYDHAGIATQLILDRISHKKTGLNASSLSDDQFHELANEWRDQRISDIRKQLQNLGACLDFDKEFYTLSPEMSESVRTAFIKLFNDGIIYRKKRPINWSFFLKSTLSDMEVDWLHIHEATKISVPGHDEPVEFGLLHKFAYPLANDMSGRHVVVATTRMETIPGDVAVVVHPDDERYADLIGRQLLHPLTGAKLPVIADKRIEMEFGSGAMKLTPAHSQADYEIALDHNLTTENTVFDENGCISCPDLRSQFSSLNGMSRFTAKEKIVDMMKHLGLYRGCEVTKTKVPLCSRSGDVIEVLFKDQWFIKMEEVTDQLRKDIESGRIRVIPENYKQVWMAQWLDPHHCQDWCISRQIRWGHRIPAFQLTVDGKPFNRWIAAKDKTEALRKLPQDVFKSGSEVDLVQDSDVLDTWFSSALLPFTVFGWPDVDPNPLPHYPLSLMETGYDILGCWVHRMALLSKMITGRYAFETVLLHGMVCDANGKKMTKSLGNVIDPVDVVNGITLPELWDKSDAMHAAGLLSDRDHENARKGQSLLMPKGIPACGADGLRLSLVQADIKCQALRLDVANIAHNGRLMNKMWNAYRFFELMCSGGPGIWYTSDEFRNLTLFSAMDLWMLSRTSHLVTSANKFMDSCDLHLLYSAFHQFWINEMCDVYIEFVKKNSELETVRCQRQNVLKLCMQTAFSCIHPIIPFITEELYQRTCLSQQTKTSISILEAGFPDQVWWKYFANSDLDCGLTLASQILTKLRSLRNQMPDKKLLDLDIVIRSPHSASMSKFKELFEKEFAPRSLSFHQPLPEGQNADRQWMEDEISQDLILQVKVTNEILSVSINNAQRMLDRVSQKAAETKSKPQTEWYIQKAKSLDQECEQLRRQLHSLRCIQEEMAKADLN